MNWTGGRLQRHSRNQNTLAQRQKQHFAKVRTRLQHTPQPQSLPFQPSFLRHDITVLSGGVTPYGDGSQRHVGHAKSSQRTLEDFALTRPLATRLSGMRRHTTSVKGRRIPRDGFDASKSRYLSPLQDDKQLYEEAPTLRSRHHSAEMKKRHQATSQQTDPSSQSTRHRKRKKPPSDIDADLKLLEANKRRLLARSDWAGLEPTRPVRVSYPAEVDKEKMGKRRKVDKTREHRIVAHDEDRRLIVGIDPNRALLRGDPRFREKDDKIRIRVGPGALSTQLSRDVTPHVLVPAERPKHDPPQPLQEPEIIEIPETASAHESPDSAVLEDHPAHAQLRRTSSMLLDNEADHIVESDPGPPEDGQVDTVIEGFNEDWEQFQRGGFAEYADEGIMAPPSPPNGTPRGSDAQVEDDGIPLSPERYFRLVFQTSSSRLPGTPTPAAKNIQQESPRPVSGAHAQLPDEDGIEGARAVADDGQWRRLMSFPSTTSHYTSATGYLGLPGDGEIALDQDGDPSAQEQIDLHPTSDFHALALSQTRFSNRATAGRSQSDGSESDGRTPHYERKVAVLPHQSPSVPLRTFTEIEQSPPAPLGRIAQPRRQNPDELWKKFVFGDIESDGEDAPPALDEPHNPLNARGRAPAMADDTGSKFLKTPAPTMQLSSDLALEQRDSDSSTLHLHQMHGRELPAASMINHAASTVPDLSEEPDDRPNSTAMDEALYQPGSPSSSAAPADHDPLQDTSFNNFFAASVAAGTTGTTYATSQSIATRSVAPRRNDRIAYAKRERPQRTINNITKKLPKGQHTRRQASAPANKGDKKDSRTQNAASIYDFPESDSS